MSRFRPLALLPILGMRILGMLAANPVFAGVRHTYKRVDNRNWTACLAVAFLFALIGCTPIKVKLGMKVYLDKTPIVSIAASLPKGPGVAPGEKSAVVVGVTEQDGKVWQREGEEKGKVLGKALTVTATVVPPSQKGVV